MMRPTSIPMAKLALAALCLVGTLAATTLERLSMPEMVDKSHVVVRAKVTSAGAEFSNGSVRTHYQLNVAEVWKGSASTQIDVYVPGGRAGGFRELVPGAPVMEVGSEYVVFLWIGPSGRSQIIGLSQGLFSLTRDASGTMLVERPGARETMVDSATGMPVTDQAVRMRASDVKALVRKRQNAK